jgi:hypothetical protein
MNFIESLEKKKFILSINNTEYERLKLGDFFILEELKDKFRETIKKKDRKGFRRVILDIIQLQTKEKIIPNSLLESLIAVSEIISRNVLSAETVMFRPPPKNETPKKEIKKDRWDYPTRYVAEWIDYFARVYHWSFEQIINLGIDTAAYLFQEIQLNEQLKKEWQYSLTELAYQDKDGSGKRVFVPLKRPYWMNNEIDGVIKTTKIRKDMLPAGVIIDLSGMGVMSNNVEETPKEMAEKENISH